MPEKAVEVNWEDQQRINTFSKLNNDLSTVDSLLSDCKKQLEGHEEAQNELMLVDDDDAARFLFGQCFVHTSTDDADARITKEMDHIQEQVDQLEARKSELTEKLTGLKETLYAKFGDQIQLEA